MKIIEGMKQIKDLSAKSEDLRKKVATYCADLDNETALYGNKQTEQISEWIQSHTDIQQEILGLRVAIQRTNIATPVTITINGKPVTKTIAEWIHRRRDLASRDYEMWAGLGRKEGSLREGVMTTSTGERKDVHIRRYYDPTIRDKKAEEYRSEPNQIDATLEVVNAVTDLI